MPFPEPTIALRECSSPTFYSELVCEYQRCDQPPNKDFIYCPDHTCTYTGSGAICTNLVVNQQFCLPHRCIFRDCERKRNKPQDMCLTHICAVKDCDRCVSKIGKDAKYNKYCRSHICLEVSCRYRRNVGDIYCGLHENVICAESTCGQLRIIAYNYCSSHSICATDSCVINRFYNDIYCNLHRLSSCAEATFTCHQKRVKQTKYCHEHPKKSDDHNTDDT